MPVRSPGSMGFPDEIFARNIDAPRFPRHLITSGQRQVFRPFTPISNPHVFSVDIVLQGWYTLAIDQATVAENFPALVWAVTRAAGDHVRYHAQMNVPFDTGLTFRSMEHDPVMYTEADSIIAEMGPTTFYAPFLEYGTVKMSPRPFMIPAAMLMEPVFTNGLIDAASIFVGPPTFPRFRHREIGDDPGVRSVISRVRGQLYTAAKALGDLQVVGGRSVIAPTRNILYNTARLMGDMQATMSGAMGARISRRISGRVTGRLVGVGSHTVFGSRTYSVTPASPAGRRIYNRIAGRITGQQILARVNP